VTNIATIQGTQPAGPLDVPRLAEFLAHTTKTGHSMHGIHLGVKEPHLERFRLDLRTLNRGVEISIAGGVVEANAAFFTTTPSKTLGTPTSSATSGTAGVLTRGERACGISS
jgi:hypothetical protein